MEGTRKDDFFLFVLIRKDDFFLFVSIIVGLTYLCKLVKMCSIHYEYISYFTFHYTVCVMTLENLNFYFQKLVLSEFHFIHYVICKVFLLIKFRSSFDEFK